MQKSPTSKVEVTDEIERTLSEKRDVRLEDDWNEEFAYW
jgi:hypothetical protein